MQAPVIGITLIPRTGVGLRQGFSVFLFYLFLSTCSVQTVCVCTMGFVYACKVNSIFP